MSNYWILDTDYDHYAIVYFCRNTGNNTSEELAWLLSREPVLHPAVKVAVDTLIDTHFDRSAMYKAQQDAEHCDPR